MLLRGGPGGGVGICRKARGLLQLRDGATRERLPKPSVRVGQALRPAQATDHVHLDPGFMLAKQLVDDSAYIVLNHAIVSSCGLCRPDREEARCRCACCCL